MINRKITYYKNTLNRMLFWIGSGIRYIMYFVNNELLLRSNKNLIIII